MSMSLYLAPAAGLLGLVFAGLLIIHILRLEAGTDRMKAIASAIQEGATAYLNRQYRTIAVIAVILAVLSPLAVGFILGPIALGGELIGVIISGLSLAILMTTGGAAWDNAKKYIESGHLGGRKLPDGSPNPTHAAAVVGDTVGDPTKDTAGPAINPLIKVMNIVAILFASSILAHSLL